MDDSFSRAGIHHASDFNFDETASNFVQLSGFLYEGPDELNTLGRNARVDSGGNVDKSVGIDFPTLNENTSNSNNKYVQSLSPPAPLENSDGEELTSHNQKADKSVSLPQKLKKKRTNRKRKRNPENRRAYNAQHNQLRREVSHNMKKSQQLKIAEEKMRRNDIGSNPAIFDAAAITETAMNPGSLQRQKPAFLSKAASKDKTTPAVHSPRPHTLKSSLSEMMSINEKLNLHPDCDARVADLIVNGGYVYIANRERQAQVVSDQNGKIFFVKAEAPKGWDEISQRVHLFIKDIRDRIHNTDEDLRPPPTSNRHQFPMDCLQMTFGLTFPQGGEGPHSQTVHSFFQPIVHELLQDPWVQKYMHHITRCFRTWFRRHAFIYGEVINRLGVGTDTDADIFANSLFCGTTINLGPDGVTIRHRDTRNLVGGLCMIGVLGDFDHRTSGHLVMEEAKVIVELRSGDVVFMPSAGITHMNTGLRLGESRASIVQYTSGDLFRWIWQGKKMLPKNEVKLKVDIRAAEGAVRWKEMYSFFPTLEELEEARKRGDGLLGFQDSLLKERINSGRSYLFPPLAV